MTKAQTTDQRLDAIEQQLDKIASAIVKGFDVSEKNQEETRDYLRGQMDIYARAVDAYAKQSETYMQEMLALGSKVDRLERQIDQIADYLKLKLTR